MRNFDQSQSWFDLENKPLIGRITFYKLHTTEKAQIYNVNGSAIANPVFTNTNGQTQYQVFLDNDIDYTVVFEKYIGQGDMTDDEETTNWLFQYSNDCTSIKINLEVESDAIQSVNCISDLRNLDPQTVATRNGNKYIELLGYNNPCDKPIVYYKWNASSTAADNGGSIIKVADISTGRWELINLFDNQGVDVRHFGVFGAASRSSASDNMSNMIYAASQYASTIGKALYFPAIPGYGLTWYKMNNLTIRNAIFEPTTRVFGNAGTTNTIYVSGENSNLVVYSGDTYMSTFHIKGEVVRTSYAPSSMNTIAQKFEPTYKLIIDSTPNISGQYSFTALIVDVLAPAEWITFDNCVINSVENIGGACSFSGKTRLTQSMFQPALNLISIDILDENVIIDIDDFPSTSDWMKLKRKQNPTEMDFKGRTVSISDYFMDWANTKVITYKNAKFSQYRMAGKTVTLENCSGTFQIYRTDGAFELYLKNSNMELTSTTNMHRLDCSYSTFTHSYNRTIDIINAEYSTINCSTITSNAASVVCKNSDLNCGITANSVKLTNCDCHSPITDNVNPYIVGCTIHNNINQSVTSGNSIIFTIMNNTFVDNGKHVLSTSVSNSSVDGKWIGNVNLTSSHFITVNRTNMKSNENDHGYVYENNTGKNTLQRLAAKWSDTVQLADSVGAKKIMFKQVDGHTGIYYYPGKMNEVSAGTTDASYYLTSFRMFSVGTTGIELLFQGSGPATYKYNDSLMNTSLGYAVWNPMNQVEKLWYSSNIGWAKNLVHDSGYTWKICRADPIFMINANSSYFPTATNITFDFEVKPK